jgi:hypothetical protein
MSIYFAAWRLEEEEMACRPGPLRVERSLRDS